MTEPYRRVQLLVLDSLPSGGKSTVADLYGQRGWEVLSSDRIREEMGYTAENIIPEMEYVVWQTLFVRLMEYLREGKNVVTDTCPRSEEERRKYFGVPSEQYRGMGVPLTFYEEVLPNLGLEVMKTLLWIDVDRDVIDQRNRARDRDPSLSAEFVDYNEQRAEDPKGDRIKDYKLIRLSNNTTGDFLKLQQELEEVTGVNFKPYLQF